MTGQQSDMQFPGSVLVPGTKRTKPRNVKMMRVRDIEVTQADIDDAVRENSHSCMIAEAIKRQIPGVKNVSVDVQSIRFTDSKGQRRVSCLTPRECQMGLIRFDRGVPPKPFRFNLQSIQVTAVQVSAVKVGADGEKMTKTRMVKRRLADGSSKEYVVVEPVREMVSRPTSVKELKNSSPGNVPSRDHIVGGALPPRHMPSFKRKFGMKGFTWDEGEDEAVILARHAAAGMPLAEPIAGESDKS